MLCKRISALASYDEEVGLLVRYVRDGIEPGDSMLQACVSKERDRFVMLDGVLYYVDPARKDRSRLVVPVALRQKLLEEMHWCFCRSFCGERLV